MLVKLIARYGGVLSLVGLLGGALPAMAHAQQCGDVDGSGTLTDTDGVNVFRQATGLSSSCANDTTLCDVDGDGTVTQADGLAVLRAAGGLPISFLCPSPGVERFAGRYQGTFSGEDHGTFDVDFDCTGEISGVGLSTLFDEDFDIFGVTTASGDVTLTTGATSSQSTFRGTVSNDGQVSGQWSNSLEGTSGVFQGSRTQQGSCS